MPDETTPQSLPDTPQTGKRKSERDTDKPKEKRYYVAPFEYMTDETVVSYTDENGKIQTMKLKDFRQATPKWTDINGNVTSELPYSHGFETDE